MVSDAYRYILYFVPAFPIDRFDRYHRDPEKELKRFVDSLAEHIRVFGLQNPPCCQRKGGLYTVRPGKCRVSAYRTLGHDTIPVFLVDYDQIKPRKSWELLPYDPEYIQERFFSGDCVIEMERRVCNIKKNVDAVHRPGVINQFERELNENSREMLGENFGDKDNSEL